MCNTKQSKWLAAVFAVVFQMAGIGWAQEVTREPPPDEEAADQGTGRQPTRLYSFPVGQGGVNLGVGVEGQYIDNVFLTHTDTKDDFLLIPELDVGYFYPFGISNTLALDVGVAYYQYFKNTSLNTGIPLINPNSDFAFNIHSGDFLFHFSEAFSFQQDPVYEYGDIFYNVFDTGLFARYFNRVGTAVTWDMNRLQVNGGYYHENLWANSSRFSYINHASDLLSADTFYAVSPDWRLGWEAAGSDNRFATQEVLDSWRAQTGPALRWDPTRLIHTRVGAGYERIQYDSGQADALGLDGLNTYYVYGAVEQELSRILSHTLEVVHDNQLGYNAGNLAGTRVNYSLAWRATRRLTLLPRTSVNFFKESFESQPVPNTYFERFTYIAAGVEVQYQFNRHWRGTVDWEYRLKDSEYETSGYAQNRAVLGLNYTF